MALRIRDWDRHFENASSRKLKRLEWVAIPNKMDGSGYTALVEHPDGAAHLGAWYAIIEIASRREVRGVLPPAIGGNPHDVGGICQSLGRISRLPWSTFKDVIPRLLEIGWLEEFNVPQIQQVTAKLGESANTLGESADVVGDKEGKGREGKGREHTHTQRAPIAADRNGDESTRFDEFWGAYPLKQRKDVTVREWLSVVNRAQEDAVFACLARYLASDQVARGVVQNPDKWLRDQHHEHWAGEWPRPAPKGPQRQNKTDAINQALERL